MSVESESKHGSSNAQMEVDKLKELVKMLERQNETLRRRSVKLSPHPKQAGDGISLLAKPSLSPTKAFPLKNDDVFNNEDEIKDKMNNMELDDDDPSNWLIASPSKFIKTNNKSMSLEKWMSNELENPSTPDIKAAKNEIITQLNPPYSRPIFENYTTPVKVVTTGNYTVYDEIIKQRNESVQSDNVIHNENVMNERFEDTPMSPTQHIVSPHYSNNSPNHMHHTAHHMPLPSHTRTTQHGLSPSRPSNTGRYRSPSPNVNASSRRNASFDRNEKALNRRSESPIVNSRPMTPTDGLKKPSRQSLPAIPRGRTLSPHPNIGAKKNINNKSNLMRFKPNTQSTSEIKSKLGTPTAARPQSKLAAPSATAGSNYDLIKYNNNGSRSQTPRRSLPRPSQTSTKNQFVRKKLANESGSIQTKFNSSGTNSPRGSDAGSDITWSEGEFF